MLRDSAGTITFTHHVSHVARFISRLVMHGCDGESPKLFRQPAVVVVFGTVGMTHTALLVSVTADDHDPGQSAACCL